jgi:aryl-alcohol dehydrogenase-like predicted oxidoreductase
MIYNQLGSTDLQVSKLCLGTMTFGEQNSEQEAHEQLDYAIGAGINFIDTAEMYSAPGRRETQGSTERIIGSWLKKRTDRDKLIIATKITGPSAGLLHIRNPLNFSSEQIKVAIDGSLKRLQTDYVDIYQLHWPERNVNKFGQLGYEHDEGEKWEDNFLRIIQDLNDLIRQGKIRHWGVSNETPWGLMHFIREAEIHGLPKPVTIQNPYSLLNRTYEIGLAEISMRENIGLLAYSPMAYGLLSGKFHNGSDVSKSRVRLFPKLSRYSGDISFDIAEKYVNIALKYGLKPAQMSLAYVNTRPFLWSTIIGATTMEQLWENIGSIDVSIPKECMDEIESLHLSNSNPAP